MPKIMVEACVRTHNYHTETVCKLPRHRFETFVSLRRVLGCNVGFVHPFCSCTRSQTRGVPQTFAWDRSTRLEFCGTRNDMTDEVVSALCVDQCLHSCVCVGVGGGGGGVTSRVATEIAFPSTWGKWRLKTLHCKKILCQKCRSKNC